MRAAIAVVAAPPVTAGSLDKAIIRRYVRRRVPQIEACYEAQRRITPTLRGTLTLELEIAPSGRVSRSDASGVAPEVARCAADVIRQIEFPKPVDGDSVVVTYPLKLRPPGD